ncbi:hypothetical protein [Cellulomonas carbonis]|uniref:Uncharacterized protein n=1 Tax=Cellulomonas carbonis T26 TaxID=947969 RepID=A0A0A0BP87_9CELL|nr:hypothetical protein [Cellulomonas carbonis]KGM10283.1 hypothetical protein N868_15880 [Cellulomonas carbonis T26]GGC05747.1 hypothetical protein GCM10010972_18700 [Cellulomonas carbonis]
MSMLPLVALMSVPKSRRRKLLPIALPAVAGVPAAAAGAVAVVTADSVTSGERAAAAADATSAVTAVLTAAVAHGAELEADDLKHVPLAHQVVTQNPAILSPVDAGITAQQVRNLTQRLTKLEKELASKDQETAAAPARSPARRRTTRTTSRAGAAAPAQGGGGGDGGGDGGGGDGGGG